LILPWNYPLLLTSWKVAPAMAMGNTVVVKPAEATPLTALRLGELALEAGLPAGVLNIVPGKGSIAGEALIRHPLVRKISFTGSTEDRALPSAASSLLGNSGQDCCARSRLLVERSIYDSFITQLTGHFQKVKVGDPLDEKTEMGPLVSLSHRQRVQSYIDVGQQEGATLLCGGKAPEVEPLAKGAYLNPTLFGNVRPEMKIAQEEIFGPVLCAIPFDTEADAVAIANNSLYGLSGSIWTRDIERALRVARSFETGVLSINSGSSVHLEAPFGGVKHSGVGRELGLAALDHYSELKSVFIHIGN
jgi:betaine-aldehyde dehydrogenase